MKLWWVLIASSCLCVACGDDKMTDGAADGGSNVDAAGRDSGDRDRDGGRTGTDSAVPPFGGVADRGYRARPCGLDLDRDGTRGEPEDCAVCNATVEGGNVVAGSDVAGATQIFVDCDAGTDAASCGSAGNPPCGSIEYAWNTVGSGGYEIVCFRGTCAEADWEPDNRSGGNPTTYSVDPTGSQVRAWNYPSEPKMLLGWDTDGDGEFPPFDADETAVLDGSGDTHRFMSGHLPGYVEIAHLSARQYNDGEGTGGDPNGGFVGRFRGYEYIHDVELDQIGNGTCQSSGNLTFTFFGGSPEWIALENILATADGGYFIRGAGGDGPEERGPMRFQNITVVSRGIDETGECGSGGGRTTFIKLWGYYTGVEVLDNIRDCDLDNWNGRPPQWGCGSGVVDVCSQDWDIVNNEFRNSSGMIGCQGGAPGFCEDSRPIRDIRWDRNVFINTRPAQMGHQRTRDGTVDNIWEGATALGIGSFGDTLEETCQDLTITNNVFYWTAPGYERMILYTAGGPAAAVPGFVRIANNTFYGHLEDSPVSFQPAGILVMTGDRGGSDFTFENNLIAGGESGCRHVVKDQTWSAGGNLNAGNNVYDPDCDWEWDGTRETDLGAWSAATGDDASVTCDPALVDPAGMDIHLAPADTCARDAGRPSVSPVDIDGDMRPQGAGWDVGADEATD